MFTIDIHECYDARPLRFYQSVIAFVLFALPTTSVWGDEPVLPATVGTESGDDLVETESGDDSAYLDQGLAESEDVIVIWGARPDKPFERDTKLRLTREDLKKRGINNLAEALDLLPEVRIRAAGRGGRQIDIRGARKGSVKILLDGIAINDPYYGNIDLSAIPVTDIEQIRVSAAPASPIDGAGGPGGVIEIFTSDAIGETAVRARITGSSFPTGEISATGRTQVMPHLAVRLSTSIVAGAGEFELLSDTADPIFVPEDSQRNVVTARVEYRKNERRLVADIWTQQLSFVVPPADDGTINLVIDGETQGRLGIAYDDMWNGFRVQGRGHYHLLSRQSTYYVEPTHATVARSEDISANRGGAAALVNRSLGPFWNVVASANLESDAADVQGFDGLPTEGRATIFQTALGAQYKKDELDISGAAGVAVPIGLGAKAWPEFKLAGVYTPTQMLELKATVGRKGRTPTLRERYSLANGNRGLGPEKNWFAEAGASVSPWSFLKVSGTAYTRRTNGLIRRDPTLRILINTENMAIRGLEGHIEAKWDSVLRGGATWSISDAESEVLGTNPLDFFPRHRWAGWLQTDLSGKGATLRLQYTGSQIDGNMRLPSQILLQISTYYRFSDRYLWSVRAENLLGAQYESKIGVRAPGRVVFTSLQFEWK